MLDLAVDIHVAGDGFVVNAEPQVLRHLGRLIDQIVSGIAGGPLEEANLVVALSRIVERVAELGAGI